MTAQPPVPTCVRHPDRPTGLACTRCGRPACPQCLRPAAVGQHCVDCVRAGERDTRQVRTIAGAQTARNATSYVTYGLIALNVAIYAITAAQTRNPVNNYNGSALFRDWVLFPPWVADGDWWRVLGSGFLHYGPLHLFVNMFALYIIGRDIELVLGRLRYLSLYLVSLLGGAAGVMVFAQDKGTAGASGAIYGLFGAMTVILIRLRQNPNQMLILIGINVFISFSLPGVSLWGHLGGLLAGTLAAVGVLFGPTWLGAKTPESARIIGWATLAVVAVAALATIVGVAMTLSP